MFVLRPSSPIRLAAPRVAVQPVSEQGPPVSGAAAGFVDEGPVLPDSYDVDIIRAMLQDPFRIFVYWSVRQDTVLALSRYFSPEEAAQFRPVLRLIESKSHSESFFDVELEGRYWMLVFPDREYRFEVGLRSPVHGYIALVRSNRIRVPRGTVSPDVAEEPAYRLTPPQFIEVLQAAGFGAAQMMKLTLSTPGGEEEEDRLSSLLARLPGPVLTAVMCMVEGKALTIEFIEVLPEPLRSELMKLFVAGGGTLAAAGLAHFLPELLRELTDNDRSWIESRIHPLHLLPRFFSGASENVARPGDGIWWPGLPRRRSSADMGGTR